MRHPKVGQDQNTQRQHNNISASQKASQLILNDKALGLKKIVYPENSPLPPVASDHTAFVHGRVPSGFNGAEETKGFRLG